MRKAIVFILALVSANYAAADSTGSVGDWASSLLQPVTFLGHTVNVLCFLAGGAFLVGAIIQYKFHRDNPQQVRLSTPIIMLILGIAIILVPLIAMTSQAGWFLKQ